MLYNMLYSMLYNMVWICIWAFLPEMDLEGPGLFTASKRIIQDFASEKNVDNVY